MKILEPERWHADLEQAIENRYGLKMAIVVDNDNLADEEIKRRVGDAAGRYLLDILSDGDVLGVSLGSTIEALVDQLPDRIHRRVEVVQLIGGSSQVQTQFSPAFLTTRLADLFTCSFTPSVCSSRRGGQWPARVSTGGFEHKGYLCYVERTECSRAWNRRTGSG